MRANWGNQARCQAYIEVSKSYGWVDDFKMRDGTGDNSGLKGKRRQGVMIIYLKKLWRGEVL